LHLSNVKILTTIELPAATMISVAYDMACGHQRLSISAGSRLTGILLRCMSTDQETASRARILFAVESHEHYEDSNAKPFSASVVEGVLQYCCNAVIYSAERRCSYRTRRPFSATDL
jgi:hypothetical protein